MNISFNKNWKLENETKIGVLMFQKVAKTGNTGKKTTDYLLTVLFRVPVSLFIHTRQHANVSI